MRHPLLRRHLAWHLAVAALLRRAGGARAGEHALQRLLRVLRLAEERVDRRRLG